MSERKIKCPHLAGRLMSGRVRAPAHGGVHHGAGAGAEGERLTAGVERCSRGAAGRGALYEVGVKVP